MRSHHKNIISTPTRPYGQAELLVEASFADLRHGGDGDLSKAFTLVEKVSLIFSLLIFLQREYF
jgi:hypothetical protein